MNSTGLDGVSTQGVEGRSGAQTATAEEKSTMHVAPPLTVFIGDVVDAVGIQPFHWILLAVISIVFGAEAMEIFLLTFIRQDVMAEYNVGEAEVASLTTVVFIGMLIGCILFGWSSDAYGRRSTCLVCCSIGAAAGFASVAVSSFSQLAICRFLVGLGAGGGHVAPSYLLELIPTAKRERCAAWTYSFWTSGIMLQTLVAYLLRNDSWRMLVLFSAVPLGVCALSCLLIIESPRFHLAHGRHAEALAAFQAILKFGQHGGLGQRHRANTLPPTTNKGRKKEDAIWDALLDGTLIITHDPLPEEDVSDDDKAEGGVDEDVVTVSPTTRTLSHSCVVGGSISAVDGHFDDEAEDEPPSRGGGRRRGSSGRDQVKLNSEDPKNGVPTPTVGGKLSSDEPKTSASDATTLSLGLTPPTGASALAKMLFTLRHPKLRRINIALAFSWASTACGYYGIIMLTTATMLRNDAYLSILLSSVGELPVYPLLGWSARRFGRRVPLQVLPLMSLGLLLGHTYFSHQGNEMVSVVLVMLLRCTCLLLFDMVYLYTPECYPTVVRTTATGMCSACARVSSAMSPLIAFPLLALHPLAPVIAFCTVLYVGFVAAAFMPLETVGLDMDDDKRRLQSGGGDD